MSPIYYIMDGVKKKAILRLGVLRKECVERKEVLFHTGYFIGISVLYGLLRGKYLAEYHKYSINGGDSLHVYAAYIIIAVFLLLHWQRIKDIHVWHKKDAHAVRYFFIALAVFFVPADIFSSHRTGIYLTEMAIRLCAGLGIFFALFGKRIYYRFRQEIHIALLMIMFMKLSTMVVDQYWHFFSSITMVMLRFFLPLLRVPYSVDTEQYIISAGEFTVGVGPACAGIGFLVGYSVLFLFALSVADHFNNKINKKRAMVLFLAGLIAMMALNGMRVFLILGVGVWYSQEFAISLFHNGIGAVLFLLFFFFFIERLFKKIIINRKG